MTNSQIIIKKEIKTGKGKIKEQQCKVNQRQTFETWDTKGYFCRYYSYSL